MVRTSELMVEAGQKAATPPLWAKASVGVNMAKARIAVLMVAWRKPVRSW
jgi:hypothetical protein